MNILICEDNPIVAMDLGWKLQDLGHRVCGTAGTSIKAMEQCALKQPDLVLVDLNLADGRTGLGLVEALAQLHVPSIIVSADANALSKATSAKAVLSKPFDEVGLAQAVAAASEATEPAADVDQRGQREDAALPTGAGELQPAETSKPRRAWFAWFRRQGA
jgi:two-component system, response regulator PdtaR